MRYRSSQRLLESATFAAFAAALVVLGPGCSSCSSCAGSSNAHDQFHGGCLATDGKHAALIGESLATIDVETGAVVSSASQVGERAVCYPDGTVAVVESDERIPFAAPFGDGETAWLVQAHPPNIGTTAYERERPVTQHGYDGELMVGPTLAKTPRRDIALRAEMFPAMATARHIIVRPIGIAHDKSVLFAVSRYPTSVALGAPNSSPLGLYALDVESGKATEWAPAIADEKLHTMLAEAAAVADGGNAIFLSFREASAFETEYRMTIVALHLGSATPRFRVELPPAAALPFLATNTDGSLVAAALRRSDRRGGRVEVLDGATGARLWQRDFARDVALIAWLRDGSLLVVTNGRALQRSSGRDGRVVFETTIGG